MGYNKQVLNYADELVGIFGNGHIFFDEEIRRLYAHDLSNPPWVIDYLIRRVPDVVCVAQDRDQVVKVLRLATAGKIPITPAAARSAAYGGAVPAKGGILLDLTRLNQRIEVDAKGRTVTCDPGVVIWNLQREVERHGLTLATYPTSAPSATIGGFVCQGGVGMGSYQHGPIANQVLQVELVTPNGEVHQLDGKDLELVNECEGITGVVTQVTLRLEPLQPQVPTLAVFDSMEKVVAAAKRVDREFDPWNVTIHNPTFSQLREEAGGPKTVPKKKWSLLVVFNQPAWDQAEDAYPKAIEDAGGKLLDQDVADADWGEIFNTLRAKRLGPSIAPGEAVFPLAAAQDVLADIDTKLGYANLSMEITVMSGGWVTVLAFALDDERRAEYPLGFAAGIHILRIAKKHGGRAYAPGLYLAAEARRVFGAQRFGRITAFKKAMDRAGIMNPGKIIGVRPRGKAWLLGIPSMPAPPGAPMSTVDRVLNAPPMVFAMGKLAPMMKYNRPADDRLARPALFKARGAVAGGSFGQKHDWNIYICSQCMYCRDVSPLSHAVGSEAGSPSGLIHWAKLYVQGRLEPTRKVADLVAAASETYVGDDVCPSKIPLSQVFRDWKIQLEHDYETTFSAPPSLKRRIGEAETMLKERAERWATPAEPPNEAAPEDAAKDEAAGAKAAPKPAAKKPDSDESKAEGPAGNKEAPPAKKEPATSAPKASESAPPKADAAPGRFGDVEKVIDIEGIGPAYEKKLAAVGIKSTQDLLAADAGEIASKIDVVPKIVAQWQQMADLARISGVGKQYAEVLVRAGVTSTKQLVSMKPAEVVSKVDAYVAGIERAPTKGKVTEDKVAAWIKDGKTLAPVGAEAQASA